MSYTNPSGSAIYNQTTDITNSRIVIGPDTTSDTYAQTVNLTSGKTISGAYVRSGGYANSGTWTNITVESGGSFRMAGGVVTSITAASGAYLDNMGGGALAIGGKLNIASGASFFYIDKYYDVYTDADGWTHNWVVRGAVHIRNGVKFKDPGLSSFLYVSAGASMWGGDGTTGGLPIILASGYAGEFKAHKMEINYTGAILGGSTTTISSGIYVVSGKYVGTGTAPVATFSVKNGVVSDLTLLGGYTTKMVDLTLADGLKADAPVISSGGSLFLKRGGTATDVVWTPVEGKVYIYDGAQVTFASDYSGVYYGSANTLTLQAASMTDLSLDAGTKVAYLMNGGKVTDTTVNNGYLFMWGGEASGIVVSGTTNLSSFVVRGGHVSGLTVSALSTTGFDRLVAIASSGALIEDATIQWGRLGMSQGATVSNATVTGGALDIYDPADEWHYDRAAMLVKDATVTAGRIFFRGSNASGANIVIDNTTDTKENHIQNGAYVSGITIRNGKLVEHYNGTLVDGDLRPFVENIQISGGNMSIGWGSAQNIWISGGALVLYGVAGHGTVVEDLAISGGKVTALSNGVLVSGATLTGSQIAGTVVSWGSMDMYAAGSGRDIVVSGGQLTVSGGATIDNLTVTGSGGWVTNSATFLGGQAFIASARVNNLVVSGAKVANQAVSLGKGAVVSGGTIYAITKSNTVYMGDSASWNVVTVSAGNIYQNGGGSVTNLTQIGGQVIARGNKAYISGADVTGTGQIYAQNGAKIYDLTLSNGGFLEVRYQNVGSSGAAAENVIIGAGGTASLIRYGIARNVTVESGGSLRVGNTGSNYVSRGYVSGASIEEGGTLIMSSGAWVSGTVAQKGANLTFYTLDYAGAAGEDETYASIQSDGVDFTYNNGVFTGLSKIDSGMTLLLVSGIDFDASQIGYIGEGGYIGATDGTSATNATISSGGLLRISAGGSAATAAVGEGGTLIVSGGAQATGVTVAEGGTAEVHVGEGTYAEVGTVTVDGTTVTGEGITSGVTIAVDNGITFDGQTLLSGGGIQLNGGGSVGGLTATGGELTIKGGYLSAATVGADTIVHATGGTISGGAIAATLYVDSGTAWVRSDAVLDNVVIADGAVLSGNYVKDHAAKIKNATVLSGGKLDLAAGAAYVSGLLVEEGGKLKTAANNVLVGTDINIAAGTWNIMPTEAVVDGVLDANGSSFKDIGAFYFYNGFTVQNVECNIYLYVSNGAQVRDVIATTKNGVAVQNGGYAYNVRCDAEGDGRFYMHNYGEIALGGAETDIAQGKVFNVAGTTDKPYDWYVSQGVIKDLSLGSGATYAYDVQTMHLREGIKADAPIIKSGGQLILSSGVEVTDAKMYNAGGVHVSSGALLSGTTAFGGTIRASSGGVVKDTLMSGYAIVSVYAGGYVSGVTVEQAGHKNNPNIKVLEENAVVENVTLSSGGFLYVSDGLASNVTVMSFGSAILSGGGTISGAVLNDTHSSDHSAIVMSAGNCLVNDVDVIRGNIYAKGNGSVTNLRQSGAQVIMRGAATFVSGAVVTGKREGRAGDYELGRLYFQDDAVGSDITVGSGGMIYAYRFTGAGGYVNQKATDIDIIAGGSAVVSGYGNFYDIRVHSGGRLNVGNNGYASGVTMAEGASGFILAGGSADTGVNSVWNLYVSSGAKLNAASGAQLVNLDTKAGAQVTVTRDEDRATFAGSNTNIAANTVVYSSGTVANTLGFSVENGVVKNLGADGKAYRLAFGQDMTIENATVNNGWRASAFQNAVVSGGLTYGNGGTAVTVMRDSSCAIGMTLSATASTVSGLLNVWDHATAEDITVSNGGVLRLQSTDTKATGTVVEAGGWLDLVQAASLEDTTLKAGAKLVFSGAAINADTGDKLTLDFTGATGNQSLTINDLGYVADTTEIVLVGETAGNTYTIATTGATDKYVNCGEWGLYDDSIKAGESITNAFTGMTYDFNAAGTAIAVSEFTAATQATAGSIEDGTTISGNGKAAKWTANTTATGIITAATSAIAGDAWLEIDGTDMGGTTLFGAEVGFAGEVNLYATGDAVINNLAAGATSSGTVAGVKLTVDGATVGLAYAGGFGTVANAAETLIEEGTFTKDFYAGALANYAKTGHATQVGSVSLTITDGEFSGNIYGASAVKAGAATSLVHSVGDVTITVKDGESKKGAQACLFAGGYATGTVASDSAVYTVGNIDVTIENGTWGAAAGGRGVFGGVFASGVTAAAEDVSITITGGTMGNVYGGGWAQKGGTSVVDDVEITITGGTIANVFGGGSHSTSGGTTIVDDVKITVAGGNITGTIYAKGNYDNDRVTGDEVTVTFTGDNDYSCDVFGYSYAGTGDSDLLSFTAYEGTFSGSIGGFDEIALAGDTALEIAPAAEKTISGNAWTFDVTERNTEFADAAMLEWSGADFSGRTVTLNLATTNDTAWTLAEGATAYGSFAVQIGENIISGLALDDVIENTGTVCDGWGFKLEESTLKFKKLA